jgi:hypothetical protein
VDSLAPSSYLRLFLQSHETWRSFLPLLVKVTLRMVKKHSQFTMKANKSILDKKTRRRGADLSDDDDDDDDGGEEEEEENSEHLMRDDKQIDLLQLDTALIDLGSDYANSLGFDSSVESWDALQHKMNSDQEEDDDQEAEPGKSSARQSFSSSLSAMFSSAKKKKKRRSRKSEGGGSGGGGGGGGVKQLDFSGKGSHKNMRESLSVPLDIRFDADD